MATKGFFITGTDTDVGKTLVAGAIALPAAPDKWKASIDKFTAADAAKPAVPAQQTLRIVSTPAGADVEADWRRDAADLLLAQAGGGQALDAPAVGFSRAQRPDVEALGPEGRDERWIVDLGQNVRLDRSHARAAHGEDGPHVRRRRRRVP